MDYRDWLCLYLRPLVNNCSCKYFPSKRKVTAHGKKRNEEKKTCGITLLKNAWGLSRGSRVLL